MKKLKGISIVLAVMLTGCATLFKGGLSRVDVNSTPPKAEVYVDGELYGETPTKLQLKPNRSYRVEIRHGDKSAIRIIQNSVGTGWIVLDVLGGLIPIIVDASTGNWFELDTDRIHVTFENGQIERK